MQLKTENETTSWFFEKINKLINLQPDLPRMRERRHKLLMSGVKEGSLEMISWTLNDKGIL